LYPHRFTDWLRGEPWYFFLALLGTKLPVLTLTGFVAGFLLLFRRQTGDGRYFLAIWFAIWALGFMFVGGKFTRYILSVLPAVLITTAFGIQFAARRLGKLGARLLKNQSIKIYASAALPSVVILFSIWSAVTAAPHYRFYVNGLAAQKLAG